MTCSTLHKIGASNVTSKGRCYLPPPLLNLGVYPCGHPHVVMAWRNIIFHDGILNFMVEDDIAQWKTKSHGGKWWNFPLVYPAPKPIHKGGGLRPPHHKGGTASGRPPLCRYPYGWVSGGWVGKTEIRPWQFKLPPTLRVCRHICIRELQRINTFWPRVLESNSR